ncbi:MAG: molybdopterin-dependent oxidoreductase [Acidobacteriota bacterium]
MSNRSHKSLATRRGFLAGSLRGGAAALLGGPAALRRAFGEMSGSELLASAAPATKTPISEQDAFANGRLLETVPFAGEGNPTFDTVGGEGLGGRLVRNLSTLTPETLITTNERFFIRTRYPDQLDLAWPQGAEGRVTAAALRSWRISVGGLVRQPGELKLDELMPLVEPMGADLLECSGNSRFRSFGLMSAAHWSGIPVAKLLEPLGILPQASQVMISGFDRHSQPQRGSTPGASWIFSFEQLDSAAAFLATHMNGVVLPTWLGGVR